MDGIINSHERRILDEMRINLGISLDEAEKIEKSCAPLASLLYYRSVEAVAVGGIITTVERNFLDCKMKETKIDPWVAREIENSLMSDDVSKT